MSKAQRDSLLDSLPWAPEQLSVSRCKPHLWNYSFCLKTIQHRLTLILPYCSYLPEVPKNYHVLLNTWARHRLTPHRLGITGRVPCCAMLSSSCFSSYILFMKCWLRVKFSTLQEEFGAPRAERHISDALNVQTSKWFLLLPFDPRARVPFLQNPRLRKRNRKVGPISASQFSVWAPPIFVSLACWLHCGTSREKYLRHISDM